MQEKTEEFNPNTCFKSHILHQHDINPVKLVVNNYSDSYLFIITQKNKLGSFVEVERQGGEIDVRILNGSSKRNDKYEEIVRTLAEMLLADPQKILGITNPDLIALFESKLSSKQILFNMCLNLNKLDENGDLQEESDQEMVVSLYKEWKTFWGVEDHLKILCN